jgi:CheY-like chemotaxis protein
MKRRLLLVDDRSWSIDSIIREFEANEWEVVQADSLIDGVEALVAHKFTAAVFDRRMPRPSAAERVQLEALGIPQAWIDALNSFNIGAALGRLVSVLDLRLPYVYVSALSIHAQERPIDWPEDRAPMIDKMKVGHKITLGMQVYAEVSRLLDSPT